MFPPPGRCLFPTSPDDAPAHRFCGQRCRRGSPYCAHHRTIAYIDARDAEIARIGRLARIARSVDTVSVGPQAVRMFVARLEAA